ncbi:hypothetical protein QFZ49_001940 [Streptomyces turgidiscabies]|uniref:Uncharacterized protein n=1 Tax=Streptomyces turgidiscabies TaxID=85558 RepID=A0ABU0RM39_9ACTN|nr:hypothetical protein [Streptomyces turgidiscabies]
MRISGAHVNRGALLAAPSITAPTRLHLTNSYWG